MACPPTFLGNWTAARPLGISGAIHFSSHELLVVAKISLPLRAAPIVLAPLCPATTAKHFVISNNACRLNREIIERRRKLPVETWVVDESFAWGRNKRKKKKGGRRRWISLTRRNLQSRLFRDSGNICHFSDCLSRDFEWIEENCGKR